MSELIDPKVSAGEDERSIPVLRAPDFKPAIPPHLIAELSKAEVWHYEKMSVMEQNQKWLIDAALEQNRHLRSMEAAMIVRRRQLNALAVIVVGASGGLTLLLKALFK